MAEEEKERPEPEERKGEELKEGLREKAEAEKAEERTQKRTEEKSEEKKEEGKKEKKVQTEKVPPKSRVKNKSEPLREEIELEEGVKAEKTVLGIKIKGQKGEVEKQINARNMEIEIIEDKKIILKTKKSTKREIRTVKTTKAHIENMQKGVIEGHKYILKICSSHFPMNVNMENNQLIVKNFFGEKYPRTLKISPAVQVKIEGDNIILEGADKEKVGQTAASIELLGKRTAYDRRIFQDGIYLIEKNGKQIEGK